MSDDLQKVKTLCASFEHLVPNVGARLLCWRFSYYKRLPKDIKLTIGSMTVSEVARATIV